MDPINNGDNDDKYRWILENLCHEYRFAFDSLKELMIQINLSGQQDQFINQNDYNRYQNDISIIDSNLYQLSSHYGKYYLSFPLFFIVKNFQFNSKKHYYHHQHRHRHQSMIQYPITIIIITIMIRWIFLQRCHSIKTREIHHQRM